MALQTSVWSAIAHGWPECRRVEVASRPSVLLAISAALAWGATSLPAAAAAPRDKVFTVANYPVEAHAKDAVEAKRVALANGQTAGLRSLLRRIVPVTAYPELRKLTDLDGARWLGAMAVGAERNSRTDYSATMDFSYRPQAVRELLRQRGIPFVDEQAPVVKLVVTYLAPKGVDAGEFTQAAAGQAWQVAWQSLDLDNSVAPGKLEPLSKHVHPDTVAAALDGDGGALRVIGGEHGGEQLVLVAARPDASRRKLEVLLLGEDAVGKFGLRRSYRLTRGEFAYTAELAAVITLGILEGRWKHERSGMLPAVATSGARAGTEPIGGASGAVRLYVEFAEPRQWQALRQRLTSLPGVQGLQVGSTSPSGAAVVLHYPGGGDGLAITLAREGLSLEQIGETWVLRSR